MSGQYIVSGTVFVHRGKEKRHSAHRSIFQTSVGYRGGLCRDHHFVNRGLRERVLIPMVKFPPVSNIYGL